MLVQFSLSSTLKGSGVVIKNYFVNFASSPVLLHPDDQLSLIIEDIYIHPVEMSATFDGSVNDSLYMGPNILKMFMASAKRIQLQDERLSVRELSIQNLAVSPSMFIEIATQHYEWQLKKQLLTAIAGRARLLGDPIGLLGNLGMASKKREIMHFFGKIMNFSCDLTKRTKQKKKMCMK